LILPFEVKTTRKGIKLALHNSLMHYTDEDYFDVRQAHDRRTEYVQKKGQHCIFTPMMCKLSRRTMKKIEAMQARHHMKDATNITLPS
jgi:hypothetical protein